jgi:hypothetical protein
MLGSSACRADCTLISSNDRDRAPLYSRCLDDCKRGSPWARLHRLGWNSVFAFMMRSTNWDRNPLDQMLPGEEQDQRIHSR